MKNIQILFILLIMFSCGEKEKNILESNVEITVKYQTLDEKNSPNNINCADEIREYKKMNKYDCSFQVEDFEFDIEKKYILDSNGNIKEYWRYKSEGPLIYKIDELKSDSKFLKYTGETELNIRLLENRQQILDKEDTLTIERIFQEEKLILIKKEGDIKKNGRRLLFEYK